MAEKNTVLCVGVNPAFDLTVTVDGLDDDRVNRVLEEHCQAAGKAANVACGLAARGVAVTLLGLYGEDNYSRWSSAFEERSGGAVRCEAVLCPGETRRNMTLLTEGRTIKVNFGGCRAEESHVQALAEMIKSHTHADCPVVFTGSLPPGMSCGDYLGLMSEVSRRGGRIVIDSDRLSRQEILSAGPWIYKPNAHELAAVCGADSGDDDALIRCAQQLAREGVSIVLLTLGGRGLAVVTAQETVRVPARRVTPVNTVGAGDAALAAFIAAQLRGDDFEACAQKAARAGESVVMQAH